MVMFAGLMRCENRVTILSHFRMQYNLGSCYIELFKKAKYLKD